MIAQINQEMLALRPALILRRLLSYVFFEGRPLTTKGRWINPLILAQFHLIKSLPQLKKVIKPIYILGMGRSGTTLLGTLFHMHSQCGLLNEPKIMWYSIFPNEDLIGSYTRGTAYYYLDNPFITGEIVQKARRLFGYYLFLSGASRVVDKYPEMIFRIPFVRAIFPDAKLVFLIRSGMDTLRSIVTWSSNHAEKSDGEFHDWWGANDRKWYLLCDQVVVKDPQLAPFAEQIAAFSRQEDKAAVEWIVSMREGLKWMRSLPAEIFPVRYESLIMSPDTTLEQLLAFCELPNDQILRSYARKVLTPPLGKQSVTLHPIIRAPFQETMHEMGYSIQMDEISS
jgi:hypothetical protein